MVYLQYSNKREALTTVNAIYTIKNKTIQNIVATVNAETLETMGHSYRFLSKNLGIAESNLTNVFYPGYDDIACVTDVQRRREDAIVFFIPEDLYVLE